MISQVRRQAQQQTSGSTEMGEGINAEIWVLSVLRTLKTQISVIPPQVMGVAKAVG